MIVGGDGGKSSIKAVTNSTAGIVPRERGGATPRNAAPPRAVMGRRKKLKATHSKSKFPNSWLWYTCTAPYHTLLHNAIPPIVFKVARCPPGTCACIMTEMLSACGKLEGSRYKMAELIFTHLRANTFQIGNMAMSALEGMASHGCTIQ